jgi:hypothetical protein
MKSPIAMAGQQIIRDERYWPRCQLGKYSGGQRLGYLYHEEEPGWHLFVGNFFRRHANFVVGIPQAAK